MPFSSPRDICLENYVLNIPFMKSFTNVFTVKSSGWSPCHVRWYLRWQNVVIFQHIQKLASCLSSKDVIYKQSWLSLKPRPFPVGLYIRQNDLYKELQRLRLVALVLQISDQRESVRKLNFREALTHLSLVYQLHWEKFIFHGDRKSGRNGSFIIYSRDCNVFCPFLSIVFEEIWTYFEGVWSKLIISDCGIWYFSTQLTIWWWDFLSYFFIFFILCTW